jgi:hypothetical protein
VAQFIVRLPKPSTPDPINPGSVNIFFLMLTSYMPAGNTGYSGAQATTKHHKKASPGLPQLPVITIPLAGGGNARPYTNSTPYTMFVQQALVGTLTTLKPAATTDTRSLYSRHANFLLMLSGVAPSTTWFTDRPDRKAGSTPTQEFVNNFPMGYVNPPNAAMTALLPPTNSSGTISQVSEGIIQSRCFRLRLMCNITPTLSIISLP